MISNEQIQALQAAIDAIPVTEWIFCERQSLSHAGGGFVSINGVEAVWCLNKAVGGMAHSMDVLRYIAAANPSAILSLLAERDADKALIEVYREAYAEAQHMVWVNWEAAASMNVENEERKRRIAELERENEAMTAAALAMRDDMREARALTVKFRERCDCCYSEQEAALFDGVMGDVTEALESACAAAGITLVVGE